jgi:hypothetical protein
MPPNWVLVDTANGGIEYMEGGLEYVHRSAASRKSRRKGNPVPGGIAGPPRSWGDIITDIWSSRLEESQMRQ